MREPQGAIISDCEHYRYHLWRTLNCGKNDALFVMLNPSTADASEDDPTIRRCMGYAREWGCHSVHIVNLFAWRSTDPKNLPTVADPVGLLNKEHIVRVAQEVLGPRYEGGKDIVVCAWGTHGTLMDQDRTVYGWLEEAGVTPKCLRLTKDGHPAHPLYLPKDLKPIPFEVRA